MPAADANSPLDHNRYLSGLAPSLIAAASRSARETIHNYADDDRAQRRVAALSAGATMEYLVRACIAALDPVLLADRNSLPSLIALSRANSSMPLEPRKLRTLGIMQTVELLRQIRPNIIAQVDAQLIMDVRNAAAHVALVDDKLLAEAVARLAQVCSALLSELGADESDFWGSDLTAVVATLKDEYATEVIRRVQAKIAHSIANLERLLADLNPEGRERTLTVLESRTVRYAAADDHIDRAETCPACGRRGQATYIKELGNDFETDFDEDSMWWTVDVYFWFSMFQCPVCNLFLDSGEEVGTDIPSELDSEREVTSDPSEGWEPEEDWVRGR